MNEAWFSPSVMCIPAWQDARTMLKEVQDCGAQLLHADVMDGEFVPNLMLGTDNIKSLRKESRVPIDLHLMIQCPEKKIGWFDIQPGDYVSVHVESTQHLQRALALIREKGAHPCVAINPATPLSAIEEVLCDVDMVLVMTVNPGFAGQQLVPQALEKVKRLRKMLDDAGHKEVRIQVDGNVSFENIPKMRAAGADVFVCGTSSIFHKDASMQENVARMMRLLEEK